MGCGTSTYRGIPPPQPNARNYDHLFKITVAGDANTGKSSILSRFSDGKFSESFVSTVGIDFKIKTIKVGDITVKLQIWDTAGQERFRSITSNYYRGADCIIIVFGVNNRTSFDNVPNWLKTIHNYCADYPRLILVGNKIDARYDQNSCVSYDEAADVARQFGVSYFETSAKQNDGVSRLFTEISKMLIWKDAYIER